MTTTTVINAQSFGTSINVGDFKFGARTPLQATTTAIRAVLSVTLGEACALSGPVVVRLYHATSPTDYSTGAAGALACAQTPEYIELSLHPTMHGSLIREKASQLIPAAAGYHYCWLSVPKLPVAATVTVKLEETP